MKNLPDARALVKLKIVEIMGGRGMRQQLAQIGIGVHSIIVIDRDAPFSGPLIIAHDGTKIAMGRGIAAKILVEEMQ